MSPEHRVLKYMAIPAEMVHVGDAIFEVSLVSELQGKCSLAQQFNFSFFDEWW